MTYEKKETISDFLDKIAVAQMNSDEWVEVSPEIIAHYNRKGLGGAKYFIFQGIKVCENGTLDEILNSESTQRDQITFGSTEGVFDGQ